MTGAIVCICSCSLKYPLDCANEAGNSPLSVLAAKGHHECVADLLELGARPSMPAALSALLALSNPAHSSSTRVAGSASSCGDSDYGRVLALLVAANCPMANCARWTAALCHHLITSHSPRHLTLLLLTCSNREALRCVDGASSAELLMEFFSTPLRLSVLASLAVRRAMQPGEPLFQDRLKQLPIPPRAHVLLRLEDCQLLAVRS